MTVHTCPTGWHLTPSANCYESHRCRCQGCRTLKTRRNAKSSRRNRRRVTVNVDADRWAHLVAALHDRRLTVDQWLTAAANQIGRTHD